MRKKPFILSVDVISLCPQCGQAMTVKNLTDLFCRACAAYLSGLERNLHAATGSSLYANRRLSHLLCFPSCSVSSTGAAASAGSCPRGAGPSSPSSYMAVHPQMLLSPLLAFSLSIRCPMVFLPILSSFPFGVYN